MPFRVTDITSAPKMTLYDLIFPTGTPVKPSEQQKRKPKSLYATTIVSKEFRLDLNSSTFPSGSYYLRTEATRISSRNIFIINEQHSLHLRLR